MMPPRPDPAPLSETEIADLLAYLAERSTGGLNDKIRRLLATVRALQQRNQELEIRVAALDPNHMLRDTEVPK